MPKLEGSVESIVFRNDENHYTVARFRPNDSGRLFRDDLTTIVGTLPGVQVGELLSVDGEWEKDPKYGRQLHVTTFVQRLPASPEGITRYWHLPFNSLGLSAGRNFGLRQVETDRGNLQPSGPDRGPVRPQPPAGRDSGGDHGFGIPGGGRCRIEVVHRQRERRGGGGVQGDVAAQFPKDLLVAFKNEKACKGVVSIVGG